MQYYFIENADYKNLKKIKKDMIGDIMKINIKKITLQNIADDVGVSKGLVSLALSNKYGVSEETRSKIVLRAIEMGYDFSTIKAKKQRINFTIIIDDLQMINEIFWSKIVKGIEKSMNTNKIAINILIWNKNIPSNDIINNILNTKPRGVIIINKCDEHMLYILSHLNLPIVLIDIMNHMSLAYDHLLADNYGGGLQAAKLLASHNHKRLVFLGHIDYAVSFQERYQGFKDYFKYIDNNGQKIEYIIDDSSQFGGNGDNIFNKEEFIKIMKSKNRPTAVFCANDPIAIEVYKILANLNLKIPEDVSVVGFDNIETCKRLVPTLTSINVSKESIGKEAVMLLMRRIANPNEIIKKVMLGTELIVRDSVIDFIE